MFYDGLTAEQCQRLHAAFGELRAIFGDRAFYGDQLVAVGRNTGFLDDEKFVRAVDGEARTGTERAMIWRFHVLAWAGWQATRLDGDFVECGVYEGVSTRVLARYLDFATLAKSWFLYDLFDNLGGDGQGVAMPHHGPALYRTVVDSMSPFPNIRVVQGRVPEIFASVCPERVAFFHLDLNDADAELAALEMLFPRLVPGGMIVLDDYGWAGLYRRQQETADRFFAIHDHRVLELPTGQGLVVKR